MQFLHHNWRNKSEIADLRQDVYERVCEAALRQRPYNTKAFSSQLHAIFLSTAFEARR